MKVFKKFKKEKEFYQHMLEIETLVKILIIKNKNFINTQLFEKRNFNKNFIDTQTFLKKKF